MADGRVDGDPGPAVLGAEHVRREDVVVVLHVLCLKLHQLCRLGALVPQDLGGGAQSSGEAYRAAVNVCLVYRKVPEMTLAPDIYNLSIPKILICNIKMYLQNINSRLLQIMVR